MVACSNFTPGPGGSDRCRHCFHEKVKHTASQRPPAVAEIPASGDVTGSSDTATRSRKLIETTLSGNSAIALQSHASPPSIIRESRTSELSYSVPGAATGKGDISSLHAAHSDQTMSPQRSLPLCKFGTQCHRINPDHFEKYSHPPGHARQQTDHDHASTVVIASNPNTTSSPEDSSKKRVPCKYGKDCNRKNPHH